jgi:hypothetical protein
MTILEVGEDPLPGKFMFSVSNSGSEDLPVSIFPHTDNYEKSFGDILDPIYTLKYDVSTKRYWI